MYRLYTEVMVYTNMVGIPLIPSIVHVDIDILGVDILRHKH